MTAVESRSEAPAPREGVKIPKATVAVVALEGAPADVEEEFLSNLKAEASEREIMFADTASARYLLRIYFSAENVEGKAEYAYVIEIFSHDKKRVRRLDEAITINAGADGLWGAPSDEALKKLSASAAGTLYAFLTNTPEAAPASSPALALASSR